MAATISSSRAQCNPQWLPLGVGLQQSGTIARSVLVLANEDIVVGGFFGVAGNVTAHGIARWDGTAWSALDLGLDPSGPHALAQMPNGDILAGGEFTHAGFATMNSIARWDGSNWNQLGTGILGLVQAITVLPNGNVVAGGNFHWAGGALSPRLAQWDGSNWTPLGGPNSRVTALAIAPNGDLVVGGWFTTIGGIAADRMARWDGTTWSAMGTTQQPGMNHKVNAVAIAPNGDVFAAGEFTTAGAISASHIARWDGNSWNAMGSGLSGVVPGPNGNPARSVVVLANGDVVVAGDFAVAGSVAANNIARWDGSDWNAVDTGLNGGVNAVATRPDGDVVAAGVFTTAGNAPAAHIAHFDSCAALVTAYGNGCTGSGGLNTLTATSLPRAGTTFTAEASGMPASSIALVVSGFAQLVIPLPAIFSQGVVGCTALVAPDLVSVTTPTAGTALTQVPLPNTAAALGFVFHHQVVPFDLSGATLAITSTNGLTLKVGI